MNTKEYKFDEKEKQLLNLLKNKNEKKPTRPQLLKLNKNQRSDFHTYLVNKLIKNKNRPTLSGESKDVGKQAEKLLKRLTKEYVKEYIDKEAEDKDFDARESQKGDKGLEDFRYKNIFFDSKVKKVENFDFEDMYKEKYDDNLYNLSNKELLEIINNLNLFIDNKYKVSRGKNKGKIKTSGLKTEDYVNIINDEKNKNQKKEIDKIVINKMESKTTGDAQLISYVKLKKELEKNFKMFYIILIYDQIEKEEIDEKTNKIKKIKINKIKFVYVVDIYKIDFSKLSIYLSNQFYFSNKEFYDKSLEPKEKQYNKNQMMENIKTSVKRERTKQINKYIKELEDLGVDTFSKDSKELLVLVEKEQEKYNKLMDLYIELKEECKTLQEKIKNIERKKNKDILYKRDYIKFKKYPNNPPPVDDNWGR